MIKNKVDILFHLKKFDEAFELQQASIAYKDSIYQKNVPLQITQLSKKYELEKAKIEKQRNEVELKQSRTLVVALIVITVLLCVVLFIVRNTTQQLKNKNKVLLKNYKEIDRYVAFTKERIDASIDKCPSQGGNLTLFEKVERYMKEDKVYRTPELTRDDVAEYLGTNRQYLVDAIKAATGKTFLDYVNEYRLNYARYMLMTDETVSVGTVILESGFSSSATFYRLFKDAFGMSPGELRQANAGLGETVKK